MNKFKANTLMAAAVENVAEALENKKEEAAGNKEYYDKKLLEQEKEEEANVYATDRDYLTDRQQEQEFVINLYTEMLKYLEKNYVV